MTRILIVEDVPDNAELARKILASRGYDVTLAETAEGGFQLAFRSHPDLILLDLGLPDHDGLTLVSWLRADPAFKSIPIIAFTAWPQDTAKQMAESYGCNGFITKPIEKVQDFISQIDSYLTK